MSATEPVINSDEGQILYTHTTGKGLKLMGQSGRLSSRYFFTSPVQAVVHPVVHESFGLSPLTVFDMKVLGFTMSKNVIGEMTTCHNGYAISYRSHTDMRVNDFKLVFVASVGNELIQWVGSEDSENYCRGAVSHYDCVQEISAFSKYHMLTPEMVSGLWQTSGSQSSMCSVISAHARNRTKRQKIHTVATEMITIAIPQN
eukprot:2832393-Amphidinium_carterae.1